MQWTLDWRIKDRGVMRIENSAQRLNSISRDQPIQATNSFELFERVNAWGKKATTKLLKQCLTLYGRCALVFGWWCVTTQNGCKTILHGLFVSHRHIILCVPLLIFFLAAFFHSFSRSRFIFSVCSFGFVGFFVWFGCDGITSSAFCVLQFVWCVVFFCETKCVCWFVGVCLCVSIFSF